MDNFGGIAVLVLIWIIGAVFDKKRKAERRRRAAGKGVPTSIEVEPVSRPRVPDPSQLEGGLLEKVLRQIDPELANQALGKAPAQAKVEPIPRASSPVPGQGTAVRRAAPSDRSAESAAIINSRLRAADAHEKGRTAADHAVFHEAIREPQRKSHRRAAFPVADIRRAIVWREILGPPRAETIDDWDRR